MSEEAKKDQAKETEIPETQLEKASGGAGFMYFKDSPILGEATNARDAEPSDIVSEDDADKQTIGGATGGVWKTTNGGADW